MKKGVLKVPNLINDFLGVSHILTKNKNRSSIVQPNVSLMYEELFTHSPLWRQQLAYSAASTKAGEWTWKKIYWKRTALFQTCDLAPLQGLFTRTWETKLHGYSITTGELKMLLCELSRGVSVAIRVHTYISICTYLCSFECMYVGRGDYVNYNSQGSRHSFNARFSWHY